MQLHSGDEERKVPTEFYCVRHIAMSGSVAVWHGCRVLQCGGFFQLSGHLHALMGPTALHSAMPLLH